MAGARAHEFDAVLCCKLDRFGRSMIDCVNLIQELDRLSIRFICATQPIDTDHRSANASLFLNIIAAFSEFERAMIRERVAAGMKRYSQDYESGKVGRSVQSRSGKNLAPHRPRRVFDRQKVRDLAAQGLSVRKIAKEMGVGRGTIERTLKGT